MSIPEAPTQLASPDSSKLPPQPHALKLVDTDARVQLIDAKMIRVHIREQDNWDGEPLYEAILKCATRVGIAGATVYSGILGYGAHRPHIQWRKRLAIWRDDPVTVVIVDTEENVKKLINVIEPMVIGRSMIAMSDVTIVVYAADIDHTRAAAAAAPQQ